MKIKYCQNCEQLIGKLEKPFNHQGHIVCKNCKILLSEESNYTSHNEQVHYSESVITTELEQEKSLNSHVRPWVRYWARMFDIYLYSLFFGLAIGIIAPDVLEMPGIILGLLVMLSWVLQESMLLSSWGTTPGKWLFKTHLRDASGNKLKLPQAAGRSLAVWIKGLGLGIPIVTLFTLLSAKSELTNQGITSWDKDGSFVVTHKTIGAIRIIIAIIFFMCFFILTSIANEL